MVLVNSSLYIAFRAAGADPKSAERAASEFDGSGRLRLSKDVRTDDPGAWAFRPSFLHGLLALNIALNIAVLIKVI